MYGVQCLFAGHLSGPTDEIYWLTRCVSVYTAWTYLTRARIRGGTTGLARPQLQVVPKIAQIVPNLTLTFRCTCCPTHPFPLKLVFAIIGKVAFEISRGAIYALLLATTYDSSSSTYVPYFEVSNQPLNQQRINSILLTLCRRKNFA